ITSLFTAIFITKLFLDYEVEKGRTLKFYTSLTEKWFKDTSFDFISQRRKFYIISVTIIAIGIGSFIFKGFGLGIDFKGGRSYVVRFEQNVNTDDVRKAMTDALEGDAPEVKTFGGFDQVKITTDYLAEDNTPDADKQAEDKI